MAHNIHLNEQTGKHSFFSVNEKAWHGLGQIVEGHPSSAEAIKHAGLDFEVRKMPLFTFDRDNFSAEPPSCPTPTIPSSGQGREVPGYFATVRTDTDQVLGVVGKDYEIVQNRDAFRFFDAIVDGDGLPTGQAGIQYETAGALGNGERIFITATLPGYIEVGSDDLIGQYLFLTTSHDGLGSITAAFTPVRIVCNNTLNAALRNCSNSLKIRHRANAKERLEEAHRVMGICSRMSAELGEIFNRWAKVRITDTELLRLIQLAMVPNKEVFENIRAGKWDELSTCFNNICNSAYEYSQVSPTQQTDATRGTLFGAYNAVTGYFQNVKNYKNGEAKLKSLIYGGSAQIKGQKAFEFCAGFEKGDWAGMLN